MEGFTLFLILIIIIIKIIFEINKKYLLSANLNLDN